MPRVRRPNNGVSGWTRQAIIARDGCRCYYCQKLCQLQSGPAQQPSTLTIDHLLPLGRGGTAEWHNLVVACYQCNHSKGNRTLTEFMAGVRPDHATPWMAGLDRLVLRWRKYRYAYECPWSKAK